MQCVRDSWPHPWLCQGGGSHFCVAHLGEQHEDDVTVVLAQTLHHFLIQLDELGRRSIGGEERRQQRAQPPVLQDGLQQLSAL